MTTEVPLYRGPRKRDIVEPAYELCGQAGYEFELEPEEYASALRRLDMLMAQLKDQRGIDLGYNFPVNGRSGPDEESGIPLSALDAISGMLARAVAPGIGKSLSGEANALHANAVGLLYATYSTPPTMSLRDNTPAGAGNGLWSGRTYLMTSD